MPTRRLDVISYVTTMLSVDFVDGSKLLDFKSKGPWFKVYKCVTRKNREKKWQCF